MRKITRGVAEGSSESETVFLKSINGGRLNRKNLRNLKKFMKISMVSVLCAGMIGSGLGGMEAEAKGLGSTGIGQSTFEDDDLPDWYKQLLEKYAEYYNDDDDDDSYNYTDNNNQFGPSKQETVHPDGWAKNSWYGYSYYKDNKKLTGWQTIDNIKYYFDQDGNVQSGMKEIDGVLYYLGTFDYEDAVQGKRDPIPTGFYQDGSSRYSSIYYIYEDQRMAVGWVDINGKQVYFNSDGSMKSGWQDRDGKWYYLGDSIDDYGFQTECWYDGCWLGSDGAWDAGISMGWYKDSWGWYIEDNNGWYPENRWQKIDGTWYYFDEYGYMVRATWRNIGGSSYYFNFDGSLAAGAILDGEETGQWIDGFWVDHSGAWTGTTGYWVWDGYGYKLYDSYGDNPKSTSYIIDQAVISFDAEGYATSWGERLTTVPPMGGAASATKQNVIQYACRNLGFPYVYGGQTIAGTDCSGFVMLSYQSQGISIPHNAGLMFSTYSSQEVWVSEAQPGDPLFYYSGDVENDAGTGIGHVALYIGNGETVEAGDQVNGRRWQADKACYIIK